MLDSQFCNVDKMQMMLQQSNKRHWCQSDFWLISCYRGYAQSDGKVLNLFVFTDTDAGVTKTKVGLNLPRIKPGLIQD